MYDDRPDGGYPGLYHKAMSAIMRQNEDTTVARYLLARLIRYYRRECTRRQVRELVGRVCSTGWPVRARPNGRYT